jgi:hypothetical protein
VKKSDFNSISKENACEILTQQWANIKLACCLETVTFKLSLSDLAVVPEVHWDLV